MLDDSEEKILREWNTLVNRQASRYSHLVVFTKFNDFYRYLSKVARDFGKKERKNQLNQIDKAVAPRPIEFKEEIKMRKEQKKREMENTTTILTFLKRARRVKNKVDK